LDQAKSIKQILVETFFEILYILSYRSNFGHGHFLGAPTFGQGRPGEFTHFFDLA
jgi:hypothetical protein